MLLGQQVRQVAYYVEDVREAALHHMALFGSGPFFMLRPEMDVIHRGKQARFDLTAAVGQWGALQVEFMEQPDDSPSVLLDLYPAGSGRTGFHHFALFVDDLDEAITQMKVEGLHEAARMTSKHSDVVGVFIDAVERYGHFIEMYEPKRDLVGLYDIVAKAAEGFNGKDPIREITV